MCIMILLWRISFLKINSNGESSETLTTLQHDLLQWFGSNSKIWFQLFFSQEFLHNTLRNCQNQNYFVHIFTSNKKTWIVCLYCVVNNLTHGWTTDFNLLGLTIGYWAEGWCSQIGYRCEQGCVTSKKFWKPWHNVQKAVVANKMLVHLSFE